MPDAQPDGSTDSAVVRFTRHASTPGLELVCYPNLTRGWRGIPEAYTWFTMIPWLEGNVEVISRGVRAQCQAGSVTIGEPGEPYALQPRSGMRGEFRVLRVDNAVLDAATQAIGARGGDNPFPREPIIQGEVPKLFERCYDAIARGDVLETQERLLAFTAALLAPRIVVAARKSQGTGRAVMRARELLHSKFDTELSLDELAAAASMDKFRLLRAFSEQLGMTPHAYQMQLRMARACRLIAQQVPLAEVALAIGYSEQSALQRAFKRMIGVTPLAYARAIG